jgi:hypothetical protein
MSTGSTITASTCYTEPQRIRLGVIRHRLRHLNKTVVVE